MEIRGENGDLAALLFDGFDHVVDVEGPVAVTLSFVPQAVVKDQQFRNRTELGGLLHLVDPVSSLRAVGDPLHEFVDSLGLAGDPGFVLDFLDCAALQDLVDALAWAEDGDEEMLREVVRPAEDALTHLPAVTVARSAAENVATGAPVYAPGVIDVDDAALPPGLYGDAPTDGEADPDPPLAACFTPDGTAVCLGRVVGDPDAESGTVVALERVLL